MQSMLVCFVSRNLHPQTYQQQQNQLGNRSLFNLGTGEKKLNHNICEKTYIAKKRRNKCLKVFWRISNGFPARSGQLFQLYITTTQGGPKGGSTLANQSRENKGIHPYTLGHSIQPNRLFF